MKIFTRRVKLNRIIGDPDNQLPDKWSSTVLENWSRYVNFSSFLINSRVVIIPLIDTLETGSLMT